MRIIRLSLLASLLALAFVACGDDEPKRSNDDDGTVTTGPGSGSGPSATTGGGGACGHNGDAEPPEVAGATAAHNAWRCSVDAGSGGPVEPIAWDANLAAVAQAYADELAAAGCNLNHSSGPYGENLFMGSGSYTPQEVVDAWMSEAGCFNYDTFPECCSCTCGHYTQVLWRASTRLGCGVGNCSGGGVVWVCNYDPPGNFIGQTPW